MSPAKNALFAVERKARGQKALKFYITKKNICWVGQNKFAFFAVQPYLCNK